MSDGPEVRMAVSQNLGRTRPPPEHARIWGADLPNRFRLRAFRNSPESVHSGAAWLAALVFAVAMARAAHSAGRSPLWGRLRGQCAKHAEVGRAVPWTRNPPN